MLETGHDNGNIEDTMEVLEHVGKVTYLNTVERFHIYNRKGSSSILSSTITWVNICIQYLNYVVGESPFPLASPVYLRSVDVGRSIWSVFRRQRICTCT
jgi:hypothetical protein